MFAAHKRTAAVMHIYKCSLHCVCIRAKESLPHLSNRLMCPIYPAACITLMLNKRNVYVGIRCMSVSS